MANLIPSLNAHRNLKAKMTACSWKAGWRSLLLRAYVDPPEVDQLTTVPTADQLIVLVTSGSCNIEGLYGGRWQRARYHAGNLGMTAPGQEVTLRWRGDTPHRTLQLHLPATLLESTARELSGGVRGLPEMPSRLVEEDAVVRQIMLGLADAMASGAPDLYAETAGAFLAAHLLVRHCRYSGLPEPTRADQRLRRVDAFMRANLGEALSLTQLAEQACMSRFHFLRMFKQAYRETPFRRLTRLRMEEAQRRLIRGSEAITEIALACGYDNPAHFASAFRRAVGVTPRAYRQVSR